MTWLMEILRFCQEDKFLIKYYMINHLLLLKTQNMDNHVKTSKHNNIFPKGYVLNWSEKVFVIKKVKNTVSWTYVISNLNSEGIVVTFYIKSESNRL